MHNRDIAKSHPATGYLLAILAPLFWAGNFVAARGLHDQIPPVSLAFWRWTIATLVLTPFAVRRLIIQRKLIGEQLPFLAITALLGVTLFNTLIYIAGHTTNAINLSLIAAASPIFIVLMAELFYKEPITLAKATGTLLALSGVLLLITQGSLANLQQLSFTTGDLWMLAASLTFAGYNILARRRPPAMDIRTFLLSTFLLGLAFLTPWYLWERQLHPPLVWSPQITGSLLYIGILASVAAFFAWNQAIAILGSSRTAVLYYLTPIFSSIAASLFLGESIQPLHGASLGMIVGGILIANRKENTCEKR